MIKTTQKVMKKSKKMKKKKESSFKFKTEAKFRSEIMKYLVKIYPKKITMTNITFIVLNIDAKMYNPNIFILFFVSFNFKFKLEKRENHLTYNLFSSVSEI